MDKNLKRNINLDLIRVIAMIFVVMVHVNPRPWQSIPVINIAMGVILISCNSFFYMLSGELNLIQKFCNQKDYYKYYVKKIISILFPYILVTALLNMWDMYYQGEVITVGAYFKSTYKAFMTTNSTNHLWFMYPLLGMLISAPFLAKMLYAMEEYEVKILFAVAVLWNIVSIYLTLDIGIEFSYSGWILSDWLITFFAGYFCHRIINSKNKKYLYIAGFIGFVVTVLGLYFFPNNYFKGKDYVLSFLLFTMSAYCFLCREITIKRNVTKKIILFLAKHSFTEYMIHYEVLFKITYKLVDVSSALKYFEAVAVTFVISFAFAVILDMVIIFPIQKFLRKLLLKY